MQPPQLMDYMVNAELSNIYDWLTTNKLSLNIKKSYFVIFRPRQKELNYKVNLTVFDYQTNTYISLERKNYANNLGVLIDEAFSWKYHVVHLASKISKNIIGIIARLRHFVPLATLPYSLINCMA